MSSISAVDAFWGDNDEYDAKNSKYQSSVFLNSQTHPISPEQLQHMTLGPLVSRVVEFVYADRSADYTIDSCIRVRAPSWAFRQECITHWNDAKATLKNVTWMNGAALVLSGAGALFSLANPFLLTIFGVTAVVTSIFVGLGFHKISKANEQIAAWSIDPAEVVAKQRAEAYRQGFAYAYRNDLKIGAQPSKNGVLHPAEVQYLYQIYFPNFCSTLLNKNLDNKSQWMIDFLAVNPLSPVVIRYVSGQIPYALQAVANDYAKLENILKDIQKHFAGLKSDVRDQASKTIDMYNNQRTAALVPLQLARDHYVSTARAELDLKLKTELDLETRRTLQKEFDAQVEKYDLFYSVAAAPINLYFDSQIQQTRITRDNAIRDISYHESQNLAIYYPAAKDLLQRAFFMWTQQTAYQPLHFDQYNTFVPPLPSAPSMAPSFQDQVFRQHAPADWSRGQQTEYEAYLNYLRMQAGIPPSRFGG
jgi:hypothetical protein